MNGKYALSTVRTGRPALPSGALLALMLTLFLLALPVNAAAQTAQFSYAQRAVGSGFVAPQGVAVDASGNLFVADPDTGLVTEILAVNGQIPASPTINTLNSGYYFVEPTSIAVDANENVYVGDLEDGLYEMLAPAYTTVQQLGALSSPYSLYNPTAIAVDKNDNVYVADSNSGAPDSYAGYITELTPNCFSASCITNLGGQPILANGLAVDANGDVYAAANKVGSTVASEVIELTPGCILTSCVSVITSSLYEITGLARDASGDLFVLEAALPTDSQHGAVNEIVASGGVVSSSSTILTLASDYSGPWGVAVDAHGDIYVASESTAAGDAYLLSELQTGAMNFGSVPVANVSADVSMTATFAVSGYSGSFTPTIVAHYGTDYSVGAVSCTTTSTGENCSVTVTFQPTLPGGRKDALFVMNGTTRLASVLLYGIGQAPMAEMQPGVVTSPITSFSVGYIYDSTVDENGTVYFLATEQNSVYSLAKGGTPALLSITGLNSPRSIAIDGAGVLYISDQKYNSSMTTYDTVQGVQGTITLPTTSYWQFSNVDGIGDLFVNSSNNNSIYELMANGTTTDTVIDPAITQASNSAVDSAGDLFIGGYTINELTPAGVQTQINTVGAGDGMGVDAADTVYATRYTGYGGVVELPASNYTTPLGNLDASASPLGMSLGSDGTLYVGNYTDLDKVDRTQGAIAFGEQNVNTASTAQVVGIYNGGNQNLTLSNLGVSGTGFAIMPAATNGCITSLVIAPGQLCQVDVTADFPNAGTFTGTVTFTTNSLNAASVTQTVNLSGFVYGPNVTTTQSAAFGNQNVGTEATLTVTLTNNGDLYSAGLSFGTATVPTGFSISAGTGAGSCGSVGSLAPDASCTLTVVFSPTQAISYGGTVSIPVSSSGGGTWPAATFSVSGTGVEPATTASLSPSLLAFPATTVEQGYDSGSGGIPAITLTNTGTLPLTFTGSQPFTLTGPTPSPFFVFNTAGNGSCGEAYLDFALALPAGDSCTIEVSFFPGKAGVFGATLSVADNASNSPQTSLVTGIGAAGQLQFIPDQLNIIAGTYGTPGDSGDGAPASSALVSGGYGAAVDNQGNFYFSDYDYNTVRKIDTSGNITTFAGTPVLNPGHGSYSGDNGPAASATLNGPEQIAVDGFGNLYIADSGNNLIRMVNTSGTITTFAGSYGSGSGGYAGDNGPATSATLNDPTGVAVDALDNVYIVDSLNDIVREVDISGTITLFAGTPGQSGYSGDTGPATAATLNSPMQAATDLAGNVYIGDPVSKVVRQVNTSGTITTYAGGGSSAVTTTAQSATGAMIEVDGLATDTAGNLYIDIGSNQLAVVNTSQQISLIAGGGTSTASGIPSTAAAIDAEGIAVDPSGDLFINDPSNHVIDEIGPQGDLVFGSQSVGTTSAALPLTLTNTGNAAVSFYNPNEEGVVPAKLRSTNTFAKAKAQGVTPYGTVSIGGGVGTITGDFAISSGGTCNLSNGIASGASCTLNVTFSPTAAGARTGTITLYTDEPYSPYTATVQLSGTGVSTLTPQTITFTQPTSPVTYASGLQISLAATGGASGNPVVFSIDGSSTGAGSISGSTLTVTSVGSFVIDANQAGNSSYSAAPQVQQTVVVNQAPQAITFTQPTSPVTYASGLQITLSATGGASGNSVVFSIDESSTATGSISGSTLTVTSTGTLVIDANQAGNADYSSAPQVQRSITVNAPAADFSVAATPPSQSVEPGASATYPITVADVGSSFTSAVTLSVSGLPPGATGTFNPASVTPGSESGTSTLTVTTAAVAGLVRPHLWPMATPVLALIFMLPFRRWRRAWRGKLLLLVAALVSLAGAASTMGCGGGFGLKTSQTYTLTITGTGGTDTHSTTVQLTVEQ